VAHLYVFKLGVGGLSVICYSSRISVVIRYAYYLDQ
jgi:glutamate racemase